MTMKLKFWSGNRTEIRKNYEREILMAVLKATENEFGVYAIDEDTVELPGDEEAKAFSEKDYDVLVTVFGNRKFDKQDLFIIEKPLAKNLLGYRIPIVHSGVLDQFNSQAEVSNLKKLVHGIPNTWNDVQIFEENGYSVLEKGSLDDLFERLANKEFDYTTFGANEVISVFEARATTFNNLTLVNDLMFYYPFPLVFCVNPKHKSLTKRLAVGLESIENNGKLDAIFNSFYATLIENLKLNDREVIQLNNPFIYDSSWTEVK